VEGTKKIPFPSLRLERMDRVSTQFEEMKIGKKAKWTIERTVYV